MILFAQVPIPDPNQNPWTWVALICAMAFSFVGIRHLNMIAEDRDEWKDMAKGLQKSLDTTSASLEGQTKVVEQTRVDGVRLADEVRGAMARIEQRLSVLERPRGSRESA